VENTEFVITEDSLRSIWFRRAVYPRDYGGTVPNTPAEQIARVQWAAFIRSLMVFDQVSWMNHPQATYAAEHKAVQLAIAAELGFAIPPTILTNDISRVRGMGSVPLVIKGIDTVIAYESGKEYFAFVESFDACEGDDSNLRGIPVTIQREVDPKVDIRVTVVKDKVFAAEIRREGEGVSGDWRKDKKPLVYSKTVLPTLVELACVSLTRRLGLVFGAIDLAVNAGTHWFLEINPTGEWSWLVDSAGLPIDEEIANALVR